MEIKDIKDIPLCRDCNVIIERCYFCWEEFKKIKEVNNEKRIR